MQTHNDWDDIGISIGQYLTSKSDLAPFGDDFSAPLGPFVTLRRRFLEFAHTLMSSKDFIKMRQLVEAGREGREGRMSLGNGDNHRKNHSKTIGKP